MRPEQRGWAKWLSSTSNWQQEEPLAATKPFDIPKLWVAKAFQAVKANGGAAGVDGVSLEVFERSLEELQMHPDKTRIVYCKDGSRTGRYPRTQFDFLGYTFRPRLVKNSKRNSLFVSFTPAVSAQACTTMRRTTRRWNLRNRTDLDLPAIATLYNPI